MASGKSLEIKLRATLDKSLTRASVKKTRDEIEKSNVATVSFRGKLDRNTTNKNLEKDKTKIEKSKNMTLRLVAGLDISKSKAQLQKDLKKIESQLTFRVKSDASKAINPSSKAGKATTDKSYEEKYKMLLRLTEAERRAKEKTDQAILKSQQRVQNEKIKSEQKQAQAVNKALEQEYNARRKMDEAISKSLRRREQERIKSEQKQAQAVNKSIERNYKNRKKAQDKETKDQEKLVNYKRDMEQKIAMLRGSSQGKYMTRAQARDLNQLQSNIKGLSTSTPKLSQRMIELRSNLRGVSGAVANTARESIKLGDSLKEAFIKFPLWIGVSTAVMGVINVFKDAVKYVYEMDGALTDLAKVTTFTTSQLNDMKDSAVGIGMELGRSSVDIMKSFAEFGRVTKIKEEIEELSRVAVLSSNVTTLTAESAAKAVNTTMIAFKMEAKDSMQIIDQWNELQNNFRVSAEDMSEAISAVGTVANEAGIELEQLNGYVASMVGATGLSGLIMARVYGNIYVEFDQIGEHLSM